MISTLLHLPLLALRLAYAPVWDGPVPDVPELAPARSSVPADENAYETLLEFARGHRQPNQALQEWVTDPGAYSLSRQEDLLQQGAYLNDLLQEMQARPSFQPRPVMDEIRLPTFMVLRDLGRYQRLRTQHAFHKGDPALAMQSACESLRFARSLIGNHGSLVQEMIGVMVLGMALDDAEWVFTRAPEQSPSPLVRALLEVPDMRRTVWTFLQGEYLFMQNTLASQLPPLKWKHTGNLLLPWRLKAGWLDQPVPELFFQPNNSVRLYADAFLRWQPFLFAEGPERFRISPPETKEEPAGLINYIGIHLFNTGDVVATVTRESLKKEAHAHALILWIFHSRGKRPPDAWIPDPFTGKPLVLSDDGTQIRSAGLDQKLETEDDLVFEAPGFISRSGK